MKIRKYVKKISYLEWFYTGLESFKDGRGDN